MARVINWIAGGLLLCGWMGCRGPTAFDPFSPYGPVRVPPPGTGTIGSAQGGYDAGIATASRSPAFGTPSNQRPNLSSPGLRPEDRGWRSSTPAATGPSSGSAPPSLPDRFGSTTGLPPDGNFSGESVGLPPPSAAASAAQQVQYTENLTWMDPRRRPGPVPFARSSSADRLSYYSQEGESSQDTSAAPASSRSLVHPRLAGTTESADPPSDPTLSSGSYSQTAVQPQYAAASSPPRIRLPEEGYGNPSTLTDSQIGPGQNDSGPRGSIPTWARRQNWAR